MIPTSPITLVRGTCIAIVIALVLTAGGLSAAYSPPELGAGRIAEPAASKTVVGIQGFHFEGKGNWKKPARLLMVDENANATVLFNASLEGARWFYDVDPLENGTLLATTTNPPTEGPPGGTVVYELDPKNGTVVWNQTFSAVDTHDVDRLNEHEIIVANMRNMAENGSVNDDRLFIYNLTSDEVAWEWTVRKHYPHSLDMGASNQGWTHVNDVDKIERGRYLVSPRNFDQVIVVNRSTKDIEMRLGADNEYDILNEPHNPDYLEGPNGRPTILIADSGNDRVIEYVRYCGDRDFRLGAGTPPEACHWEAVWTLNDTGLNWPRDADRLPNGNTLIVDSLNHRVIEVTPQGDIVWEVFAPWAPYDAERVRYGDGSNGPTMRELGVTGRYSLTCPGRRNTSEDNLTGTTPSGTSRTATQTNESSRETCDLDLRQTFPTWLQQTTRHWPFSETIYEAAERWEDVSQWIKPVWMAPWGFVALVGAFCISMVWGLGELAYHRRPLYRRLRAVFRAS